MFNDNQLGEEQVSDYIFRRYEEYRDKCERLTEEIKSLRNATPNSETGMTDYQFQQYVALRDQYEAKVLERNNILLVQTVRKPVEEAFL